MKYLKNYKVLLSLLTLSLWGKREKEKGARQKMIPKKISKVTLFTEVCVILIGQKTREKNRESQK